MDLRGFAAAVVLLLGADAVLIITGKSRQLTYALVLGQVLFCLLGSWYFSSDLYTHTARGYRDGFFEMLACLAAAGLYAAALLAAIVTGYVRRVREITGF